MAEIKTRRRTIELRPVDDAGIEALTEDYLGGMAPNVRAVTDLSVTDVLRLAIADLCALRGLKVRAVDAGEEASS